MKIPSRKNPMAFWDSTIHSGTVFDQNLHQFMTLLPNLAFYWIPRGFHLASVTVVTYQHGTINLPETTSSIWNLLILYFLKQSFFFVNLTWSSWLILRILHGTFSILFSKKTSVGMVVIVSYIEVLRNTYGHLSIKDSFLQSFWCR